MSRALSVAKPSSRPDLRFVTALAVGALLASWDLLHVGFYTHAQVDDTFVYKNYGDWMVSGLVPYRDFSVEYPPGSLPAFVIPSWLGNQSDYRDIFEWLMLGCAVALVGFVALSVRALRRSPALPLGFAAVAWPMLGSVVLTRYDLYAAAVTAAAVASLVAGRLRLGSAILGLATAVKVYPVVVLPIVLVTAWRRGGRREAAATGGSFLAALAVVVLPFFVIAPGGVLHALGRQLSRPLQLESLGSSFLLAAHHLFGLGLTWRSGSGSQNLVGTLPDVLAALQSVALAGVLVWLWIAFARGPMHADRVARYAAASVCAFVALGKVLSPQFLIWLVPLVPLVRGRRGLAATALLATALVLTQNWFPFRYWDLVYYFDERSSWLLLARDLVLVSVLAVLAFPRLQLARK